MDKIHRTIRKPWISQTRCNIKSLIQKRATQLDRIIRLAADQEDSALGDPEHVELTNKLESFANDSEKVVRLFFMFNSDDERVLLDNPNCQLKTYQLQLNHAKQMISDRTYKVNYLARLRTTRKELLMRQLAQSNRQAQFLACDQGAIKKTAYEDSLVAIVVVQIWLQPKKYEKVKLEKEILFRSDQCLTDLRDQFKCQRDFGVPMDLSENPDLQSERIFRGELFKSGSFLIENTFYNDLRDPNSIDLSMPIVRWAEEDVTVVENGRNIKVSRGIGPFSRQRMASTRFEDLDFRLGCPYLYLHQGDCEHLFTFSDIRYLSSRMSMDRVDFPFVTATSIGSKDDNLRCYMCRNRPPHWYTRGNSRLPLDPFFFCENCFYSFNYDEFKRKIGQFQAFLYTTSGLPDNIVMRFNRQASEHRDDE